MSRSLKNRRATFLNRTTAALPGLMVVLAVVPRLWGINWGMPLKYSHIDESVVIFYTLRVVVGEPNPQVFFDYPSLFLYILACVFHLTLGVGKLFGGVESYGQAVTAYLENSGILFTVTARFFNAVLGALTVGLVFHCARRWTERLVPPKSGQRRWGFVADVNPVFVALTAAALTALNRLHVLHAHYGTVDVMTVLFSLACLYQITRFWENPRRPLGIWAAVGIGLATSLKYYPAILLLSLLPAPFVLRIRNPWRLASLFIASFLGGFIVGSPYSFLAGRLFWERFAHLYPKIIGFPSSDHSLWFTPTLNHVIQNAGWGSLFFAVLGMVRTFHSTATSLKITGATMIGLVLFFGSWNVQSAHYSLLVYPLLFVFTGLGLSSLKRLHAHAPLGGAVLLAVLAAGPTIRQLSLLRVPDTRLTAIEWIRHNLPPGSRLLRFAHTPEFSRKDPFQVQVDWENKRLAERTVPSPASAPFQDLYGYDYILYSSYQPKTDTHLEALRRCFPLLQHFQGPSPAFPHHPAVYIFKGEPNEHGA